MNMNEKPIIRMSGAGYCPRAISAGLLDYAPSEPPPWLKTSAKEGQWHEERIKKELRDEGYNVFDEQLEVFLHYPDWDMQGHIDGKVTAPGSDKIQLLECKSMSQYEFDRWMRGGFNAFYPYAAQITCYMAATEIPEVLYVIRNRNTGSTIRMSPATSPVELDEVIARVGMAVKTACQGKLAEAVYDDTSIECSRCRYAWLCVPEPAVADEKTAEQLDQAVINWRKGKEMVTQGKELMDAADAIFMAHSNAIKLSKWQHNGLNISVVQTPEITTYPKSNLLRLFTREQLAPAAETRPASVQLRVTDKYHKEHE